MERGSRTPPTRSLRRTPPPRGPRCEGQESATEHISPRVDVKNNTTRREKEMIGAPGTRERQTEGRREREKVLPGHTRIAPYHANGHPQQGKAQATNPPTGCTELLGCSSPRRCCWRSCRHPPGQTSPPLPGRCKTGQSRPSSREGIPRKTPADRDQPFCRDDTGARHVRVLAFGTNGLA